MLVLLPLLPMLPTLAVEEVSSYSYLSLPAETKLTRLWSNCLSDTTSAGQPSRLQGTVGLLTERMCPTLRTAGDSLPMQGPRWWRRRRTKPIHSVGSVARVEWRSAGGHSFTGLFRGASHGLLRMSLAAQADPAALLTIPGIGLKFLRDGIDSANLVAMFSVDGQQSWNFFRNNFSNHIPGPGLDTLPLAVLFSTATTNIQQVGLSDWARYGEDGRGVAAPSFPYRLRFQPTGQLTAPDTYVGPLTEQIATIPASTTLYQVFALDRPEELGGSERRVADLVLVSEVVASRWGDEELFFRHQDMLEDLRVRPEWNEATPQFSLFQKSPSKRSQCKK